MIIGMDPCFYHLCSCLGSLLCADRMLQPRTRSLALHWCIASCSVVPDQSHLHSQAIILALDNVDMHGHDHMNNSIDLLGRDKKLERERTKRLQPDIALCSCTVNGLAS
jgi:hypothetical protein